MSAGNKFKISRDAAAFRKTAESFLQTSHRLFPHEASELGLEEFESRLGRNDAETYRRYIRLLRETLATVEALPDGGFRGDDWLDRRGFLAMLRTSLLQYDTLSRWRNNPQMHCDAAIQAIFDLVIRHAENLAGALPAIESRLGKIPAFLAAGASCVRHPVPLWTKLAVKTCEGAEPFLNELEKTLAAVAAGRDGSDAGRTPTSREPSRVEGRLRLLFQEARTAFGKYARVIAGKEPGPAQGFAVGRENFEMLIRERLGLPYSLPEAESMGRRLTEELREELKREARKFGRRTASEIIERAAARWEPGSDSLVCEYQRATASVRDAIEARDLLTLPRDERLKILPVPEFLRHHFPTAAYHQPGPFAKDQTGIFWVNDLSAGESDPVRRRAEMRQHFGLELTCAHEGYPGHHVQFVLQNRHPSKLRRLFAHAIFYEGWTLWCEKLCIDQGIYDAPEARLIQLHDALWRAHRIVIDCGLHSGKLTHASASRMLMDGAGFTKSRASGDVNWYTSAPTVPMSYLLGRLELEKLHARRVGGEGWSLKQFHDWILSFGAIPWSWIWQAQLNTSGSK